MIQFNSIRFETNFKTLFLILSISALIDAKTILRDIKSGYPEIGFEERPDYIPNNVVVLTFDDGPRPIYTAKVLDILKQKQVKATFFINSDNWSQVSSDTQMQELVRRITREGHELASHSVSHQHLPTLTAAKIKQELSGVERLVSDVIGLKSERLTMFRAPFGEPYQASSPSYPTAGYKLVAPIVAEHAVHIGWNVDSKDYACPLNDGQCVYENVVKLIKTPGHGAYGIILMHDIQPQTSAALSDLIDYIRAKGFVIWSTEDVVRARFGVKSAQLIHDDDHDDDEGVVDDPDEKPIEKPDDEVPDKPEDGPAVGDCNAPPYKVSSIYVPGERVTNLGSIYRCKEWPMSGWCGAGPLYEPGDGEHWREAWILERKCVE